jgi:hypothetical protein
MRIPPIRFRLAIAWSIAALGLVAIAPTARAQDVTAVQVERVKPNKEKHATLRFLKENRAFIRARLDLLKLTAIERKGETAAVDPRYLDYQRMLADVLADRDSVAGADDARRRRELLASITELGGLESQLDQMERLLADQRERLAVLQRNFVADQSTALMVVLSGYPADVSLDEVAVTLDDGATVRVPLAAEQQESLRRGGIVEVFFGFVEPREQALAIGVFGAPWPDGDAGYVTLDPARDRLTLLRLDLSSVRADQGGAGIQASTWLQDAAILSGDG